MAASAVALAKGGKPRETALGLHAAALGAGDLGVGLAHHAPPFKSVFAPCTGVFINGHVCPLFDALDALSHSYFTMTVLAGQDLK
jgi:hypothetical protein